MERQTKLQDTPARDNRRQATSARSSAARPLLELQRSIGNQAVQRLIRSPYIQTKLKVSTPGDPFEQEADRVADTVMRMPEPEAKRSDSRRVQAKPLSKQITPLVQRESEQRLEEENEETIQSKFATDTPLQRQARKDDEKEETAQHPTPSIQRQIEDEEAVQAKQTFHQVSQPSERSLGPSCSGDCSIQRLCTKCEEEKQPVEEQPGEMVHRQATPMQRADDDDVDEQRVQTKDAQTATPKVTTSVAANVHALRGGGSPLPPATRAFFEPRFGADFSQVRVHTDSRAAQTAKSISARAFTVGHNIAFGADQYAPHSNEGRQLLAHELTHVVQQSGGYGIRAGQCNEKSDPSAISQHATVPRALRPLAPLGLQARLGDHQIARQAETPTRKPTSVTVHLVGPPPPVHAVERATPENRQLAGLIDALEKLSDAELTKRRAEVSVAAVRPGGDDQGKSQQELEAIEFLARRRGLAPPKPNYSGYQPTTRRLNVRALIEEGVRQTGSFKKALASFTHTREVESDIEFFQAEADRFASEFRRQARQAAESMLEGSLIAIYKVLESYGLSFDSFRWAAERLARGSDVDTEAERVVKAAALSKDVDTEANVRHRFRLAQWVTRLKKQQRRVGVLQKQTNQAVMQAPTSGEGPAWEAVKKVNAELVAARKELETTWIQAERLHPILAAYRRDGELEKADLGTLDTDPVEGQMKAILVQLLPKMVDIGKARSLVRNKKNFALTLPSVVALARANMFIPESSIRAGVVNDLASAAKDEEDSILVRVAAFALAVVTLIPSGGSSLAVAAGIGLAAYSAAREWEKYSTQKTLVNTDIDLARSLSTEEPSLTGFAVSLVSLGLEGIPLITAFNQARKIKALVSAGDELAANLAVKELKAFGTSHGVKDDLGEIALAEAKAAEKRTATHGAEEAAERSTKEAAAKGATKTATDLADEGLAAKLVTTDGEVIKITKDGELWICTNPCDRFAQSYRAILEKNTDLATELEHIRTIADKEAQAKALGSLKAKADKAPIKDWQYLPMKGNYRFLLGGKVHRGNTLRLMPDDWKHILEGHVAETFDATKRGASKISTVFNGTPKQYLEILEEAVENQAVIRELNRGNGVILLKLRNQEWTLNVDLSEGAIKTFHATGATNPKLFIRK